MRVWLEYASTVSRYTEPDRQELTARIDEYREVPDLKEHGQSRYR